MLTIIHIVPPYISFPPMKYGGTERVAYYLLKAQLEHYRELQRLLDENEILFKVFSKVDKTAIKNLHGSPILLEFIYVRETNPINYIFRVINIIRAMLKQGKNKLIIHNHTIQRNSFLLLHTLGLEGEISTLHYDPPLYRSYRLLPTLKFKGKLVAISKNQYQRLKRFLGSFLFAYVHNGIPIDEFPFCKEKDGIFYFNKRYTS